VKRIVALIGATLVVFLINAAPVWVRVAIAVVWFAVVVAVTAIVVRAVRSDEQTEDVAVGR
jgi:hypothetical protein